MPRKKVPQKDVSVLLADLRDQGATGIRRSGVDLRGMVTVRWKESPQEIERYADAVRAWKAVYVIAAIFLLIFIVLTLIAG